MTSTLHPKGNNLIKQCKLFKDHRTNSKLAFFHGICSVFVALIKETSDLRKVSPPLCTSHDPGNGRGWAKTAQNSGWNESESAHRVMQTPLFKLFRMKSTHVAQRGS